VVLICLDFLVVEVVVCLVEVEVESLGVEEHSNALIRPFV